MIWVIANEIEEDGSFPTYKHYKKAFKEGEIDIYCAKQDDDFSFLKKDDIVLMRTRDENILCGVSSEQSKKGFISTIESPITNILTHDKNAVKAVLRRYNIPFPRTIKFIQGNFCKCFVKPLYGENSEGIDESSVCETTGKAVAKVSSLLSRGLIPMMEEYIDGFDITTSVFYDKQRGEVRTYSITTETKSGIQIDSDKKDMSFKASVYVNDLVDKFAKKIFEIIGAKHHLRIDFRVSKEIPYVIDINMIPGLASNGYMAQCMEAHGIDYYTFIQMLVNTAY